MVPVWVIEKLAEQITTLGTINWIKSKLSIKQKQYVNGEKQALSKTSQILFSVFLFEFLTNSAAFLKRTGIIIR